MRKATYYKLSRQRQAEFIPFIASGKSFVRQKSRRRPGTTHGHLMSCWKLVVVISDMVDRQEGVVHDSLQFHRLLLQSLILLRFRFNILTLQPVIYIDPH